MQELALEKSTIPATRFDRVSMSPLRWVGGKVKMVKHLTTLLPADFQARLYVEPFLGGGSLFFSTAPERSLLSDLNPDLVGMYAGIRDFPNEVHTLLESHLQLNCKEYYLQERKDFKLDPLGSAGQAARFLYLNKVCFNGVYRVNQKGMFNVPYGNKPSPKRSELTYFCEISQILKGTTVRNESYESVLNGIPENSFVYLDPPYPPLSDTAFFTHYTSSRFHKYDHEILHEHIRLLNDRGCLIMLSISDTPIIRDLYSWLHCTIVEQPRYVSCNKRKIRVNELVYRNYL